MLLPLLLGLGSVGCATAAWRGPPWPPELHVHGLEATAFWTAGCPSKTHLVGQPGTEVACADAAGLCHGPFAVWRDGALVAYAMAKGGRLEWSVQWYDDGQPRRLELAPTSKDPLVILWHRNGRLWTIERWVDGPGSKQASMWSMEWDLDGHLVATMDCPSHHRLCYSIPASQIRRRWLPPTPPVRPAWRVTAVKPEHDTASLAPICRVRAAGSAANMMGTPDSEAPH